MVHLAETAVRAGLGGAGLACAIWGDGLGRTPPDHLRRRDGAGGLSCPVPPRLGSHWPGADGVRDTGTKIPFTATNPDGRGLVMPGVLRTRSGFRPRAAQDV